MAQANYFFYMTVSGMKPDADVQGLAKLTKKEDVVAALAGSFAFAHKAIATLTPANAFEVVSISEPGFYTRATLAQFGIVARQRSLRADGGVFTDEWDCAAGQPKVSERLSQGEVMGSEAFLDQRADAEFDGVDGIVAGASLAMVTTRLGSRAAIFR